MPYFDYAKDYVIEDDFVRISPLTIEHIDKLAEISDDPEIWLYFLEKGRSVEELTHYIQSAIHKRKIEKEYPFVVFDKTKNEYAGMTRFYEIIPNLSTMKLGHTWYGKKFWGSGLNTRCKYLLFEFAFEKIGVVRIGFGVSAENIRSIKALEKVGCKREGLLRDFLPEVNGEGRTDLLLYSILRKEWLNGIKNKLTAYVK